MSEILNPSKEKQHASPQLFSKSSSGLSGSTATSQDSFLDQNDLRHPYRWPKFKKWLHVIILSIIEFITPLASMMFAPVVPQVAIAVANGDITRTTLAVSVYVLGFIVGPLIFGPLSQLYGRMVIYRTTVAVYVLLSVGCALSTSIQMLTAFRFFAGCLGAAPIVIGGAAVADMYPAVRRGQPMAVYSVGPFLGLTSGPIFGGLINYYCGWRWIFWSLSIAAGILSCCTFLILRETHLPTLTKRLSRQSRTLLPPTEPTLAPSHTHSTTLSHFRTVLLPAFLSPIRITFYTIPLFLLFVSNAVFTGIMNILFTTLGATYQSRYHFTTRSAGLAYLPIGLGGVIASVVLSHTSDRLVQYMSPKKDNADGTPLVAHLTSQHLERYRLPPIALGTILVSVGLMLYGWALQTRSHWPIPLIGAFIFGLGMLSIQAGFPTYLLHAYSSSAGAVLSASIVTRSIGGSTITLAGPSLNKSLGYGWASTVLAGINLIFLIPVLVLWKWPQGNDSVNRGTGVNSRELGKRVKDENQQETGVLSSAEVLEEVNRHNQRQEEEKLAFAEGDETHAKTASGALGLDAISKLQA